MPRRTAIGGKSSSEDTAVVPRGPMIRRRKAHTKSRTGCSNCKMRSVKCDETKPSCKNCTTYRVTCSYIAAKKASASQKESQDLVYPGESSFRASYMASPPSSSTSSPLPSEHSSPMMPPEVPGQGSPVAPLADGQDGGGGGGGGGMFQLQPMHVDMLRRFRARTIVTFGNKNLRAWYAENLMDMICVHPFLIHLCFTTTIIHEAHLSKAPMPPRTQSALAFHWYHGAALFKRDLDLATRLSLEKRTRLSPREGQAFYLAAVTLSVAAIANVDSGSPARAWPMKTPEPLDLDWLHLTQGKQAVWKVADTFAPGTLFEVLQEQYGWKDATVGIVRPHGLPSALYGRLGLAGAAAAQVDSPYYTAAAVLSQILPLEVGDGSLFYMFNFVTRLEPAYRALLRRRDPRALLLLAYWYCKMAPFPAWWMRRRYLVEGLAVCEYLRRTHVDDDDMLRLLEYPMTRLRAVALEDTQFPECTEFLRDKPDGLCTACVVN